MSEFVTAAIVFWVVVFALVAGVVVYLKKRGVLKAAATAASDATKAAVTTDVQNAVDRVVK